ncbi:hypothetical protein [Massilia sp. ST3]|uniref:hypothetical protein n=1 Tax=Massilia sp. ST3 TaxID=2824903 RepID=UPI001B835006|nr:hypothetical protein [Massilia sp. ST3]MBQ5948689.1 hypothetical protein [Massilia sp. ST3]
MSDIPEHVTRMNELSEAGRHDELLALLRQSFDEVEQAVAPERTDLFFTMFRWSMLAEEFAPARKALEDVRDDQTARLLAGDLYVGRDRETSTDEDCYLRIGRFSLVVQMNETLGDAGSTHRLFARLDAEQPGLARRCAWQALPALVEMEDFSLADRYRKDPLELLEEVNRAAMQWPLFSSPPMPRMSAELSNLARDVRIGIAVLRGLGRPAEAESLREALLSGLKSDELREWARRELIEPGAIRQAFVAHQMAEDERASG